MRDSTSVSCQEQSCTPVQGEAKRARGQERAEIVGSLYLAQRPLNNAHRSTHKLGLTVQPYHRETGFLTILISAPEPGSLCRIWLSTTFVLSTFTDTIPSSKLPLLFACRTARHNGELLSQSKIPQLVNLEGANKVPNSMKVRWLALDVSNDSQQTISSWGSMFDPSINMQAEDSSLTHSIEGFGEELEEQLLVLQRHSQQAVEEPVDLRQICLLDSQPAYLNGFIQEVAAGKRTLIKVHGRGATELAC
jgi:hypothetical protein